MSADFSFPIKSTRSWRSRAGDDVAVPRSGTDTASPSPSLSFPNNSTGKSKTDAAKRAETLYLNMEHLIKIHGVESCGLTTLTFADNIQCRREAQRRFNSMATHFLRPRGLEFICAVERQARGAIHYHLCVAFPFTIRQGFDFEAQARWLEVRHDLSARRRIEQETKFFNACPALRNWWADLNAAATRFGFGRCETLPIRSTAQAMARYLGGYISKEFFNRQKRDKGLRTVRYSMSRRVAHPKFSWRVGPAAGWRYGVSVLAGILNIQDMKVLGKNWPWKYRDLIRSMAIESSEVFGIMLRIPPDSSFNARWDCVMSLWGDWKAISRTAEVIHDDERSKRDHANFVRRSTLQFPTKPLPVDLRASATEEAEHKFQHQRGGS